MKKLVFTLLLTIITVGNFSYSKSTKTTVYNGLYEGIATVNRGKALVRLHVYRYDFRAQDYRDMYDKSTKKTVVPKTTVGLIEVYKNKKGKGSPKRTFFTAISYETSDALNLTQITLIGEDNDDGTISIIKSGGSKFSIPNANSQNFEMTVWHSFKGGYNKVKNYQKPPEILNPYFKAALNNLSKRGKVQLGNGGYKSKSSIYVRDYLNNSNSLNTFFSYGGLTNYNLENPSIKYIEEIKAELLRCLENTGLAYKALIYLPHVTTLNVTLTSWRDGLTEKDSKNHFFDVRIVKENNALKYYIVNTDLSKSYVAKGELADYNKKRFVEKQKAIEDQRIFEQQKKELAIATELKKKGFDVKTQKFWNQFPKQKYMLKGILEGNFKYVENDMVFRSFFMKYLDLMSGECESLLPSSKIEVPYEYTTSENKYASSTYNGGWDMGSFTTNYNTETTTHKGTVFVDPRFGKKRKEINLALQQDVLKMAFEKNSNPWETVADFIEIKRFFTKVGCEKKTMDYLGENFLRYLNGQKSIQAEQGVVYD